MLKYRYANDCDGNLIEIDNVSKSNKGVYSCIYCQDELIARIGEHNIPHFSHKPDSTCNLESYLHVLGKRLFYSYYTKCLQTGNPFFVKIKHEKLCISCYQHEALKFKGECFTDDSKSFDLTNWFDDIAWEKRSNGFIADLLLKSSKNNNLIFIEIAVSHKCDEKKLSSGNRIIEIELGSEVDVNLFSPRGLKSDDERINYYNFKLEQRCEEYRIPQTCDKKHRVFVINENRKPALLYVPMNSFFKSIQEGKYPFHHFLNKEEMKISKSQFFREMVIKLFSKGIYLEDCLFCEYSSAIEHSKDRPIRLFCNLHYEELPLQNKKSPCRQFRQIYSKETFSENSIDEYQIESKLNHDTIKKESLNQEQIDKRRDALRGYCNQKEQGYKFIQIIFDSTHKSLITEVVQCPKMTFEHNTSQDAIANDYINLEDCKKCKNYVGESYINENVIVCSYGVI